MPVALGHEMSLWNMCHDMDAVGNLTRVVDHDEPLLHSIWPDRSDAMPFISHGIEHPVDALWGDDDFRFLVDFHEIEQSTGMVVVAVGDEDVIHRTEVNAHTLRIIDEYITGSRIKQDTGALRF